MVEGARLESVYRGNSIEGSNPSLSAIDSKDLQDSLRILDQSGPIWLRIGPCLSPCTRRRRLNCKGGHTHNSRTSEYDERKKNWRRCECPIFVSGTLGKDFRRQKFGEMAMG